MTEEVGASLMFAVTIAMLSSLSVIIITLCSMSYSAIVNKSSDIDSVGRVIEQEYIQMFNTENVFSCPEVWVFLNSGTSDFRDVIIKLKSDSGVLTVQSNSNGYEVLKKNAGRYVKCDVVENSDGSINIKVTEV